jgi:hypothetical protein
MSTDSSLASILLSIRSLAEGIVQQYLSSYHRVLRRKRPWLLRQRPELLQLFIVVGRKFIREAAFVNLFETLKIFNMALATLPVSEGGLAVD